MITGGVRRKGGLEMSQAGCERRVGRTEGGRDRDGGARAEGCVCVCVCVYRGNRLLPKKMTTQREKLT